MDLIISNLSIQQSIPTLVYKIPFRDLSHAEKSLMESYKYVVTRRGKEFNKTSDLEERIARGAEWMYSHPEKWLFLHGLVGTGKTSFLNAVILLMNSVKFTARNTDIISVKRVLARDIDSMENNDIEELKKTPILAIDDLGAERWQTLQYGNIRETSTEIIESRYDRRKLTLFATNHPFKTMEDKYGLRIYDRLREMVFIVTFTNDSYRHE